MRAETLVAVIGSSDEDVRRRTTVRGVLPAGLGRLGSPPGRHGGLQGGTGLGDAPTARLTGGFVDPPLREGVEEGELTCHAL